MLFGVGLIFLLIVVSGTIAYLGDLIGRKIGKKRISIFGLRPKYTSILITIVSGIVIVSVTISVLLLVVKQARTAFFGIQKLMTELDEKEENLEKLQKKYRAEEKRYKKSIAGIEKELATSAEQRDDILGAINLKSIELSSLQASSKKVEEKSKKLSAEVDSLEKEKRRLESRIKSLNKQYADTMGDKYHNFLQGEILYTRNQTLKRVVIPLNATEKEIESRMLLSINNAIREAVSRGATIESDAAKVFEQQFKSLGKVIKGADSDLIIELRSHTNVLKGQPIYITLAVVENSLLYKKGQIIEKRALQKNMSEDEISDALTGMLTRASAEARASGMVPAIESGQIGSIPARRFVEVVRQISGSREAKTVELFSINDTRLSEKLYVDFRVY